MKVLDVPDADRYQLLTEYSDENFRHTDGYLGLTYSEQLLIIEIAFIEGRRDDLKKALLVAINQNLVANGAVRADDVFIVITEFGRANISFGRGFAQTRLLRPAPGTNDPHRSRDVTHRHRGVRGGTAPHVPDLNAPNTPIRGGSL